MPVQTEGSLQPTPIDAPSPKQALTPHNDVAPHKSDRVLPARDDVPFTSSGIDEGRQRLKRRKPSGRTRPRAIDFDLHREGRCRAGHLMSVLQISNAKLYKDVKTGKLPPPDGNDGRPFWDNRTVLEVLRTYGTR